MALFRSFKEVKIMLEVYSTNIDVAADSAIPFNNVSIKKGTTAVESAPATIQLNKCGVYMISFDGVSSVETNVQMLKDGVAQPQAQSTGTSLSFITLVQVQNSNSNCACASPTLLQFMNSEAATFDNINVVVTKIC